MPANPLHMNICTVATGQRICKSLFFKTVAGWNTAHNKLKRDSGTDTYLPMNFSQFISCSHAKILAYVTYMGKYQKAYIRRRTFYLVIFLTTFVSSFLFK